jgi:hypothetical protein
MCVLLYSSMFEAHMQSYTGNDPLGEWERLVHVCLFSFKQRNHILPCGKLISVEN